MRVQAPLGVNPTGTVPWTNRTGTLTRRQRRCGVCGAAPYFSCQSKHVDRDGVTRWRVMRSYHTAR